MSIKDSIQENKRYIYLSSPVFLIGIIFIVFGIKTKNTYEKANNALITNVDIITRTVRSRISRRRRISRQVFDYTIKFNYSYNNGTENINVTDKVITLRNKRSNNLYSVGNSISVYYKIDNPVEVKLSDSDPDDLMKNILIGIGSLIIISSFFFISYIILYKNK